MDNLVISNVCSVPCHPDMSFESAKDDRQPLRIDEINEDFIKVEPKAECQDQQDAEMVQDLTKECDARRLNWQVPQVTLMRQTSCDIAIVSDLLSLLQDFRTMACSGNSVLCCQPIGYEPILTCELCEVCFVGKSDRMLKLCKHYETLHPSRSVKLILGAMERCKTLIKHMRKALEFDTWFNDIRYAPERRTKMFNFTRCTE